MLQTTQDADGCYNIILAHNTTAAAMQKNALSSNSLKNICEARTKAEQVLQRSGGRAEKGLHSELARAPS
jgi:hypothetical protein